VDADPRALGLQRGGRARLRPSTLHLSARHIGELVDELAPLLRRASVRDVQALPPRDLLLVLEPEKAGGILRLRLSTNPDACRLHLQHGRVRSHAGPPGPFYRHLAERLAGARLTHLEQVGGDRIVRLGFRTEGGARALVAELVGRHANLVSLDSEERVAAVLVAAAARKGGARLAIGERWRAPGKGASGPVGDAGPALAAAFPEPPEAPRASPTPTERTSAPLSWRVEASLGARAEDLRAEEERASLAARVARKLASARARLSGLERRAEAAAGAERVRQDGELLKASLREVRRGMEGIEVADWFGEGGARRRIELDPGLAPRENVERLFDRYRKLVRAASSVVEEEERARARLADLEELAREAQATPDPAALEAAAVERGLLEQRQEADERRRKPAPARLPYRSFRGSRGSEIRVGRSARDNDGLTFRHSRGGDLWLHTADAPGSHVVLCIGKGASADDEEVLDAAHLAIHFSPLRGAQRAAVHAAPRKLVHKPRGAKPGLVTLSGGRILEVRVQQARLDRLLRSGLG